MELEISSQALGLCLGALCGLCAGRRYELLRPVRRRFGFSWLFDAVFSLGTGLGLFFLTMSLPGGRLGTWELAAAALAFWAYMRLLSPLLFPLFDGMWRLAALPAKKTAQFIRKLSNYIFQKVK